MSNNTNDRPVEDLFISTQVPRTKKRLRLPRVIQNPFSIIWLKLAALLQVSKISSESEVPKNSQSEQHEEESIQERYLYTCLTDRVDPPLYYISFLWCQRN